MNRTVAGMIVGAFVSFGLAGCATSTVAGSEQTGRPTDSIARHLPARPAVLSLNGVHPCDLLSATQRDSLNLSNGNMDNILSDGNLQGAMCIWSNVTDARTGWVGGVILNRSAADTSSSEPVRLVNGFSAVSTDMMAADPNEYCQLFVDVGPEQILSTSFRADVKTNPGMNHKLACDKAQELAGFMIQNLRAQQGK